MTVWSHRFAGKTDDLLRRHGDSFSFDIRLLPEEIRSSAAHANARADRDDTFLVQHCKAV